jgi:hypothetical protein
MCKHWPKAKKVKIAATIIRRSANSGLEKHLPAVLHHDRLTFQTDLTKQQLEGEKKLPFPISFFPIMISFSPSNYKRKSSNIKSIILNHEEIM